MQQPIEEVLAFFREWTTVPQMRDAISARFTPKTVWENVGICKTVGIEEALGFLDPFTAQYGIETAEVVVDHIAATGNVVLTERTDIFRQGDGSVVVSVKLMGVFEMDGPRILRWRDYFDTKAFAG